MSTLKAVLLAILISWAATEAAAKPVREATARKVAENFLSEKISQGRFSPGLTAGFSMICIENSDRQTALYVFNLPMNKGFIVVAGDDRFYPVPAYSDHGAFILAGNNQPAGLHFLVNEYLRLLDLAEQDAVSQPETSAREWNHFCSSDFTPRRALTGVEPLLTTAWGQDCWYNARCPEDAAGDCSHAVTGCIATAMGQLMRYYNYPSTGTGSCTYVHPVYGTLTADFASTDYRWDEMGSTATETSHDAIAELLFHCGVAAFMNYGPDNSGAFEVQMHEAMINNFGYSPASSLIFRENYTDGRWDELLKRDLDLGRPVFLTGVDTTQGAGHAFICDGYTDENYYHIDWGWESQGNGYFMINNLCPGNSNYTVLLRAITGLIPDTLRCTPPRNLRAIADCNDALLSWTPPDLYPRYERMHYDGPFTGGNNWFPNANEFSVAIRFDTAQLAAFHGMLLDNVRFIIANKHAAYRLNIWKGAGARELVLDEPVPATIHMYWDDIAGNHGQYWNTFILGEPLVIDASDELWIGYTGINLPGEYACAGRDNNPGLAGYSDLLRINCGEWVSTHESYPTWDYNWSIQAFATDINSAQPGNAVEAALLPDRNPGVTRAHKSDMRDNPPSVVGYKLFRNGVQVNENPIEELSYTDFDLAAGEYSYTVSALYEAGNSIPCGASAVSIGELILNPPFQLNASLTGSDVQLSWHAPLPPPFEKWLYYDNGENYTAVGLTNGGTHRVAIRFLPEQISGYEGMALSEVSLFPCADNTGYTLFIARGPNAGEELLTRPLSNLTIDAWNTIVLEDPLPLDVTEELWVGYTVINHPANDKGAGADSGPAIAGFGDLICLDGNNFVSLVSLNPDLSFNWNLRAFVTNQYGVTQPLSPGNYNSLELLGYDVFRNDLRLNAEPIAETGYLDAALPAGSYRYYVKSVYNQGTSEPSAPAEVTVPLSAEPGNLPASLTVFTDPEGEFIRIGSGQMNVEAELFNSMGSRVFKSGQGSKRLIINTHRFSPGIYTIRLSGNNHVYGVKTLIR